MKFQHAAARRRLALNHNKLFYFHYVSTRSRPKAAGNVITPPLPNADRFNTQPPEGGWPC